MHQKGKRSIAAGAIVLTVLISFYLLYKGYLRTDVNQSIRNLKDKDPSVRREAVWALWAQGKIEDDRAVEALIKALSDEEPNVRKAAFGTLASIYPKWRQSELARRAIGDFVADLKDKDPSVRRGAAWALGKTEDARVVKPLIGALCDEDPEIQLEVVGALASIDPEWPQGELARRAIPDFAADLKDKEPSVRWRAAWALGEVEDARAVEPLIEALSDKDPKVQRDVLWALASVDPDWRQSELARRAIPGFAAVLKDGDRWARRMAALRLGEIKDASAVEPLIRALRDKDASVRREAAWALARIDPEWRQSELARRAGSKFIADLKDKDPSVRWGAAWALGEIREPRALYPLISALGDDNIGVRRWAVEALDEVDPKWRQSDLARRAGGEFIADLEDEDPSVRWGTVWALGQMKDARAVEPLTAALKGKDSDVREVAAWALERIKGVRVVDPSESPERFNVLLITVDALRADHLSCYGYSRNTSPNLDALAQKGLRFEHCISQAPNTIPSFFLLMASKYIQEGDLQQKDLTLAEILKADGYKTGAIVENGLFDADQRGLDQGYDDFIVDRDLGYDLLVQLYGSNDRADVITDKAISWLSSHHEDRFFLWVHYIDPHDPYSPPEPYDRLFDPDYRGKFDGDMRGPENRDANLLNYSPVVVAEADRNHIISLYDGEIRFVDREIGRLLMALDQLVLGLKTHVIVSADHGEIFGEYYLWIHGNSLYESEIRVPLIMSLPSLTKGGVVRDHAVQTIDIAPTICDLVGLDVPKSFLGRSLVPLIEGKGSLEDQAAYAVWKDFRAVRTPRWKLITRNEGKKKELYDISIDPNETLNLAESHPTEVLSLSRALSSKQLGESPEKDARKITTEIVEELKSLGYLQ